VSASNKGSTVAAVANSGDSSTNKETVANVATQSHQTETNQPVKAAGSQTALEKFRADEMASISEKEVLSAKISEMLNNSKGKISLASSGNKASSATTPSVLSGANMTEMASASQPKSTTAMATVTQTAGQAELPIIVPNGGLGSSLFIPTYTGDPALSANAGLTGGAISGAISGIDSTAANSASQSSMASRATSQAGSPAEQVSAQISTAAKDGVDRIRVQLHPAELGRIDIKLEIGNDGRVIAVIAADNQESLDLLKQDSRQLEQALKDAGFETGSDSLSFSLNQGQEDHEEPNDTTLAKVSSDEDETLDVDVASMNAANSVTGDGNLDIQV